MDFLLELVESGSWLLSGTICGLGLIAYVLQALALYTIAKRRGLSCPWLAWVPVADGWILGAVSDQYRETVLQKKTHKRGILLGLNVASVVVYVLCVVAFIVWGVFAFDSMYDGSTEMEYGAVLALPFILSVLAILLVCLLPLIAVLIVKAVFRWMAIWDVFKSCDPQNAQIYFLVSFLLGLFKFSGLEAVFMLICMNRDDGMIAPATEETVQM